MYPGFPPFVHYIIKHITDGKTPEEAAELVSHMVNKGEIATSIEEIERTHAAFDSFGNIVLPEGLQIQEEEAETVPLLEN